MKKNAKILLYMQRKKIRWNDGDTADDIVLNQRMMLDAWPDLTTCTELYYRLCPAMAQYRRKKQQLMNFEWTTQFTRSLSKRCTTDVLKLQVIDALTKLAYRIPCSGLGDTPIKEKTDLWHIRISYFWRVFYRKNDQTIRLLEFCPHKKTTHSRRL